MALRCSTWRASDHHTSSGALVSKCSGGVELQVRPFDLARTSSRDPFGFVVRHKGRVVRHGRATGREAAKKAARRQAGSTGGLAGIFDFLKPKKTKARVGSRLVHIVPGKGNVLRGARRRKRR